MKYSIVNILFNIIFISLLLHNCSKSVDQDETKQEDRIWVEGPVADGCPNTNYPDYKTSPYVLPYPVGKSYQVDLSNCSGSYHSEGRPDEYAIDFKMDVGTIITASRDGIVSGIEESGVDGGFPNNYVCVKHDDGTADIYMHLTHNGALVEEGQTVSRGDTIGLSGSTGLAGYPHLHFVVVKGSEYIWPYESVPVTFYNTLTNVNSLAAYTVYKAYEY